VSALYTVEEKHQIHLRESEHACSIHFTGSICLEQLTSSEILGCKVDAWYQCK